MIIPDSPARQVSFDFEEWRTIADAPDYEVSSHGRIRRATDGKNTWKGRILSFRPDKGGYSIATIMGANSIHKTIKVHREVLFAFKGAPPTPEHLASHEDGVSSNNFVWNLEWKTQTENMKLKIKHGTHGKVLKVDQVRSIRAMRDRGHTYKEISDFHSVSFSSVAHVVKRRTWVHDNP